MFLTFITVLRSYAVYSLMEKFDLIFLMLIKKNVQAESRQVFAIQVSCLFFLNIFIFHFLILFSYRNQD